MDTDEQRLAALEAEWREKYTQKERDESASKGHAMEGGSYPVEDEDDLQKAIKAVGRGNADHDAIRKHIIAQATRLKLSKLIPENWNADGSLAEAKGADFDAEQREQELEEKAEEWDAEHRSGPSHADMKRALSAAIRDLPEQGSLSAYLHDFDDDTATYESGGKLFQVPYTAQDDGSVKLGDPQEVQPHTVYKPVESKSAGTRADERAVRRRKERRRAVPLGRELRHFDLKSLEVREATDTNEIKITGQPIVYNAPYLVRDAFGEFEERMLPGCASEVLKRGVDCRLLLNHEGLAMARTTAGTLLLVI